MNVKVLRLNGPGQVLIIDAGVDAVALVQEVVVVALAAAEVEDLALATPDVVEVSRHPAAKRFRLTTLLIRKMFAAIGTAP